MPDRKKYMKQYHLDHKEHIKQYYQNHKEEHNKRMKQWRLDHPEYDKQYHLNHKEKRNEESRQYRLNHKEEMNKCSKQWYLDHKEEKKEYHKQYRQTPQGKATTQRGNTKRKAKMRAIINTLTSQEWLDILEQHNFRCVYCGKDLFTLFDKPERDHITPISKGGNNTKGNVVPACRSCNAKKSNKILKGEMNYFVRS